MCLKMGILGQYYSTVTEKKCQKASATFTVKDLLSYVSLGLELGKICG